MLNLQNPRLFYARSSADRRSLSTFGAFTAPAAGKVEQGSGFTSEGIRLDESAFHAWSSDSETQSEDNAVERM